MAHSSAAYNYPTLPHNWYTTTEDPATVHVPPKLVAENPRIHLLNNELLLVLLVSFHGPLDASTFN